MKEIILFYIDTVSEGVINLLKIIEKQQCHVRRELYSVDCGKKKTKKQYNCQLPTARSRI